jgi:SAM-dependent methyltransferase
VTQSAGQTWDPAAYGENARFVTDLGAPVLELLDPRPGERILDLGCGDGPLTQKIAAAGADVVGVDASAEMVEAAKARGLDARVVDAHNLPFDCTFDAVFSNAALHWMKRPDEVIAGVVRALKPGGRFVAEMGGHGCMAAVLTATLAVLAKRGIDGRPLIPWYFPTPDDYSARLERAGFEVTTMLHFPRATPLPGEMSAWLETFGKVFLDAVDNREQAKHEISELLAPSLRDDQGRWTADYVRLRFSAKLSA